MNCPDLTPEDLERLKADDPCRPVARLSAPINYFDLPEVSSSDLGALKRTFYGLPDNRAELIKVFNFGSLVDAMLTERYLLYPVVMGLRTLDGQMVYFTLEDWKLAERLAATLAEDPVIRRLLPMAVGQYIFRRTLDFIYEGEVYQIRGKCKFDLYARGIKTGLDFKTTAATTRAQFIESIDFLDYDKQAAYYMDLGRVDQYWIAGISKKNGKIFKVAIERGDATHKAGVAKYTVWARRWVMLIDPFALTLTLKDNRPASDDIVETLTSKPHEIYQI